MTNSNNFSEYISKIHQSNCIWDIQSAYSFFTDLGYAKSKRTFERDLTDAQFIISVDSNKENNNIKKIIYNDWQNTIKIKRLLSLDAYHHSYNSKDFIFYEDKRGKKYWHAISKFSEKNILKSLEKILIHINQTSVIWPSNSLFTKFQSIVDEKGTETVCVKDSNRIILPVSSYRRILNKDDLVQFNYYKTSDEEEKKILLSHLDKIEAEAIHIIRETTAEASNPVMLYSVGKDSAVMLHLAKKAFYPAKPPFLLMHVDTGWKFDEMYQFRDLMAKDAGMDLIIHQNKDGIKNNINPFSHGSEIHTDIMKTQALKQALDKYKFDFAFGGARRDEEKSRAKERILSFRSEEHSWDPKNQRPEIWDLYNYNKMPNESARVFPISNWTELDIWQYIYKESIPIVPLYYAAERPFVERDGVLIMLDDDRFKLLKNEKINFVKARFRTLGCYPLTGAVESQASSMSQVLLELIESKTTEREGRLIDSDSEGSMEKKKKEGYF